MKTKEKIIKELEGKRNIKFDVTKEGVTIWVNGVWVLDASLFKKDEKIRIDTNCLELINNDLDTQPDKSNSIKTYELKYKEENEN